MVRNPKKAYMKNKECTICSMTSNHFFFFFFFEFSTKENWICTMNRHHAEPNINILFTKKFPFDSDFIHRSHPLMISLHWLWAKSNNRIRDQFEYDVTSFLLLFWFRSFTCTVLLLSRSLLKSVGGSFEIGCPRLRAWKKFGRRWKRGMWDLEI